MQDIGRSSCVFVLIALLCGCNSTQNALAPQPPTNGARLLTVTNGVASGSVPSGAQEAVAIALSGSGDRSTFGAKNVFTTTTITVGSEAQPQTVTRLQTSIEKPTTVLARTRTEAHRDDQSALQALIRRSSVGPVSTSVPRRAAATTIPSLLIVGSTVTHIWAGKTDIGSDVTTNIFVPVTLEAQTAHANIWVLNNLLATGSFSGGAALTAGAKIGQDFEIAYTSDTQHFAMPDYTADATGAKLATDTCDSLGQKTGTTAMFIAEPADKRTNVMVVDSTVTGDGVGGYFTVFNYASQGALNCDLPAAIEKSNEAPMIFVLWSESKGASFELNSDFITAIAHEFQHLISFVNHGIIRPVSLTELSAEEPFINEGLSVLAQDLALNKAYPNTGFDAADGLGLASTYLSAPQNYSITGFIGIDPNSAAAAYNCNGCYGGAYLFERYMRDRFGGDAYTRAIETNTEVGFPNLVASCGCGESANQLLDDFEVAMGANSARVTFTTAAYVFGTLDLNGTYGLPNVPIGGQPSLTLTGAHQIATPTAAVPLGGAAYFALPNPSGVAISIRDDNTAAGFALTGALIQR